MSEDRHLGASPAPYPSSFCWSRRVLLLSLLSAAAAASLWVTRAAPLGDLESPTTSLAAKRKAPRPPSGLTPNALVPDRPGGPLDAPRPVPHRHPPQRRRAVDAAWGAAVGSLGVVFSVTFALLGAGYGMSKAALGVVSLVKLAPSAVFRGMAPVVMAELLAIYGFISGLNILGGLTIDHYSSFAGYLDLGAGLTVGLSCLVSGLSIGAIADANLKLYGGFIRRAEAAGEAKRGRDSPAKGLAATGGVGYGTDALADKKPEPTAEEERLAAGRAFTAMILMLIFAEGLGLYGMIVGLLMHNAAGQDVPIHVLHPPEPPPSPSKCGSALGATFGGLGVAIAIAGALAGAAYGIARAGVGAAHLGVYKAERLLRGTTPVIMSELLAIYGFVVGLIIALGIDVDRYTLFSGYLDFAAGCTVGLGCLSSGVAIGTIGDAGNRVYAKQPQIFVAMVLMLIFSEALGLYSLIVSLSIHSIAGTGLC